MTKWKQNGFTLVELMIVVAIIALLAAIAIPQYVRFSQRAKRTEGLIQIQAIHKAQLSYYAGESVYVNSTNPFMWKTLGLFNDYQPKYYMILFSYSWAEPPNNQAYRAAIHANLDDDDDQDWICITYPYQWWPGPDVTNAPIGVPYMWFDDITNTEYL